MVTPPRLPPGTDGACRPLEEATTLPARFYTDPAIFEAERELIFARCWVPVARGEDLAEPGDYVAYDLAGEPLIVVRDKDGTVRAFPNVCRHRNMTILEGSGNVKALQCPYHLWTYRLDGTLARAPQMDRASGFGTGDVCLPSLRVEAWQGWVFVNLDAGAEPLAPQVSGLEAIVAPFGLEEMRRVGVLHYPSPWNWKISVENFSESYHHAGTHPTTLQSWAPGERSWAEDNGGQPWLSLDHVSLVEGLEPFTASVVFPFHIFSIARPHGLVWFRMEVRAIDYLDLSLEAFAAPGSADDPGIGQLFLEGLRAINDEDVAVNRRTQQGLRSRFAAPGRISHLEEATWQFRRWLVERLRPAFTAP